MRIIELFFLYVKVENDDDEIIVLHPKVSFQLKKRKLQQKKVWYPISMKIFIKDLMMIRQMIYIHHRFPGTFLFPVLVFFCCLYRYTAAPFLQTLPSPKNQIQNPPSNSKRERNCILFEQKKMKRKFQFLDKKKIRSKRFCQCDGDGRVFLGNFFPNIAISSTYIFWYRSKMLIRVFLNFHSLVVYESCSFLAKFSEHSTWGRIQFISNIDES